MVMTRIRRSLALVASAALSASLIATTFAAPVAAADTPSCRGVEATIVGTPGDDRLLGTNGRDVIVGLAGDDIILGRGGNDLICGGIGTDRIAGQRGFDRIYGNADGDRLFGGKGPDLLFGGVGDDLLVGRAGNDGLDGGPGTDACFQNLGTGPTVRCELPKPKAPEPEPEPEPEPDPMALTDVLAIAYSEIDGIDGPTSGDVLIAKIIDLDGNGPDEGDRVDTSRYPLDHGATSFGNFTVTTHTVVEVLDPYRNRSLRVRSAGGWHEWFDFLSAQLYREQLPGHTEIRDGFANYADRIVVQTSTASEPDTPVPSTFASNSKDQPFIDVDIYYYVP